MVDKQLWRQSAGKRHLLVLSCLFGILRGIVILLQAYVLAGILAAVFLQGADLAAVGAQLLWLLVLVTLRFLLQSAENYFSLRLGGAVKLSLRQAVLEKIDALGPVALRQTPTGELLQLTDETTGALESYFSQYLPQLVEAAVLPVLFLCFILPRDPVSGLILLCTAPLIPFFMMLIGKWTNKVNARQWRVINRLSGYLHDVMAGLGTLKLLGRSEEQEEKIRTVGDSYAKATLAVLRWAFLSSLVLELFSTISIALVAVGLGLRLVDGSLDFATAFFILLAAPEFYQPLRALGAQFHTSLNTREAAAAVFSFLERPVPAETHVRVRPDQAAMVEFRHVTAVYPDGTTALRDVSFSVRPGEIVALVGKSGSGKTTVLQLAQGFLAPESGEVSLRCRPAAIQQKPYIFAGSILENLRFGNEALSEMQIEEICRETGLAELLARLPDGLATRVGQGGEGLSGGQRQMIAIVRALCQERELVLLDEASANLDPETERQLNQSLRRLLRGRTVLLAAHRLPTIRMADRILVLEDGAVAESGTEAELRRAGGAYARLIAAESEDESSAALQ